MMNEVDKIAIITLGCKVNQAESEELAIQLAAKGYRVGRDMEGAALCVVNTCSVTAEGDHKSRKAVGRALRAGIPVIATGCTIQANPESIPQARGLQLVDNREKRSLPAIIEQRGLRCGAALTASPFLRSRAVIKVQDGCDGACAYCIVPAARGRSRSLPRTAIDRTVEKALERGAAELVLTGVNLGDYGKDTGETLTGLIREITARWDVGRVRLSSLELDHLQGALLEELRENPKVCKHLHLPLQSGDDRILTAMRRSYKAREVIHSVSRLRDVVPEIAITLDIMVGFPGEGEAEFSHTLEAIEELRPAKLHVFKYSPRPHTEAAGMTGKIDADEKRERALRARDLGLEYQRRFVQAQVGTRTEVAIIEAGSTEAALGLTGNYVKVLLEPLREDMDGGLRSVVIKGTRGCLALGDRDS